MKLTEQEQERLIAHALKARDLAYCPHTHYAVGAAVLTHDDHIITAANVETPSGIPNNCAEHNVLVQAFLQGHRNIKALALMTQDGQAPCGTCRQLIHELCQDIPIIIAKVDKSCTLTTSKDLLPHPFQR